MADNNDKVSKGMFYALTRIIIFVVAIFVIVLGFYTGMNSMNVNVITKDAFTMRAEAVLTPKADDETDLPKLFTQDFIASDPVLNSTEYADYNISNYYQRTDVAGKIIWPWTDKVVVRATEEVLDITGTLKEDAEAAVWETADTENDGEAQVTAKDKNPPEWVSGEYEVTLVKEAEDTWKVQKITLTQEIEPVLAVPGQDASEAPDESAGAGQSPDGTQAGENGAE